MSESREQNIHETNKLKPVRMPIWSYNGKKIGHWKERLRVQALVSTIYYIAMKVFNYKKKRARDRPKRQALH